MKFRLEMTKNLSYIVVNARESQAFLNKVTEKMKCNKDEGFMSVRWYIFQPLQSSLSVFLVYHLSGFSVLNSDTVAKLPVVCISNPKFAQEFLRYG